MEGENYGILLLLLYAMLGNMEQRYAYLLPAVYELSAIHVYSEYELCACVCSLQFPSELNATSYKFSYCEVNLAV